jgi:hypothetical protein
MTTLPVASSPRPGWLLGERRAQYTFAVHQVFLSVSDDVNDHNLLQEECPLTMRLRQLPARFCSGSCGIEQVACFCK